MTPAHPDTPIEDANPDSIPTAHEPNRSAPLVASLRRLDARSDQYATEFLNIVLPAARACHASDVHLQPTSDGLMLAWRMDGVLHPLGVFPSGEVTDVVTRLKVMASLLTYRTDLPQEGRIGGRIGGRVGDGGRDVVGGGGDDVGAAVDVAEMNEENVDPVSHAVVEMRVSTFPTLHGERATVRLFTNVTRLERLGDLGYCDELAQWLRNELSQTSGALVITGPAGSGKTTTLYACLRELSAITAGSRSIITMEDPIEAAIDGVAQTQVHEAAGLTLATGIRSLVRQDPEVMMVGEIRDADSARAAIGAALTGHLLLTSFHAGSCFNALQRLRDMGLEPYMLRNGVSGIVNQRLARRLCSRCAQETSPGSKSASQQWGIDARQAFLPQGCDACLGTGYSGRVVFAEWLPLRARPLPEQVFSGNPDEQQVDVTLFGGLWSQATSAIEAGLTSPPEVRRVLG